VLLSPIVQLVFLTIIKALHNRRPTREGWLIRRSQNEAVHPKCGVWNNHCSTVEGFSLSVGPVANATDVLQRGRLIVLTLSPPTCLDVPTFAARYPHVRNDARDPSSERWNCVG